MKNTLIVLGVIVVALLVYLGVKSMYGPPSTTASPAFTDNGENFGGPSIVPTSSSGLPLGSPMNLVSPSTATTSPSPEPETVSISNFKFVPDSLAVKQGSTVVFTNNDSVAHTVTSATFDSGPIQPGGSFSQVFAQKGTFAYKCSIHPMMTGTIIVK